VLVIHGFQVLVKSLTSIITTDYFIQDTLPIGEIVFSTINLKLILLFFGGNFHQFFNITKLKEKIILVVGECPELFLGTLVGSRGTIRKYCPM
jgi:hypothetical protein